MKKTLFPAKSLVCGVFLLAMSGPALMAQFALTINNASFETGQSLVPQIPYSTTINDQWQETWTNSNAAGELLGTSAMFDTVPIVPDGSYCLWINNHYSVFQGLADNLNAGDYTFTVWVGERKDLGGGGWAPSIGQFDLLAANGANLSSATVITPTSSTSPSLSVGQWVQFSKSYTIAAGNPLIGHQLVVEFTNPQAGNFESTFDKVQLTSSVPEPATAGAFLLGGAGLVLALRRRS